MVGLSVLMASSAAIFGRLRIGGERVEHRVQRLVEAGAVDHRRGRGSGAGPGGVVSTFIGIADWMGRPTENAQMPAS